MKTFFIGLALSPVVLFVIGLSFYFFGSIGGMIAIFSGLIGYYIYSNYYVKTNGLFCLSCGYNGAMQHKPRGSGLIELILWLCFLVPGIIYTIWRGQKKEYKCPSCGENSIVRNTDMRAREYIEKKNLVKCLYCAELIKSEAVVCKHCKKELKSV